jgi:hypothetical protein
MWHDAYKHPITGFPHLHIPLFAESIPPASAAKPGDEYFRKLQEQCSDLR